jgi:hypothetical protein
VLGAESVVENGHVPAKPSRVDFGNHSPSLPLSLLRPINAEEQRRSFLLDVSRIVSLSIVMTPS